MLILCWCFCRNMRDGFLSALQKGAGARVSRPQPAFVAWHMVAAQQLPLCGWDATCLCAVLWPLVVVQAGVGLVGGAVLSLWCSSASWQEMQPGGNARRVRITWGCLHSTSPIRCAVLGDGGAGAASGLGSARRVRITRGCLRSTASIRCAWFGDGGAGAARALGRGS